MLDCGMIGVAVPCFAGQRKHIADLASALALLRHHDHVTLGDGASTQYLALEP